MKCQDFNLKLCAGCKASSTNNYCWIEYYNQGLKNLDDENKKQYIKKTMLNLNVASRKIYEYDDLQLWIKACIQHNYPKYIHLIEKILILQ